MGGLNRFSAGGGRGIGLRPYWLTASCEKKFCDGKHGIVLICQIVADAKISSI
jgi:hypothetical protein